MSLKLYRPREQGLEPVPPDADRDWRVGLRSRRWRPAPLENPEVQPTSAVMAVAFFVGLAVISFVVMVLGYASGFWALR